MHYDFIEIGTSCFDTLIEKSSDVKVGISIEPIKYYYDKLPNKKNVIKLNKGISDQNGFLKFFYVPTEVLNYYSLPQWLSGCNSINKPHPSLIEECIKIHIDHERIVYCVEVDTITVDTLIKNYNVSYIDFLKIDTEGHDIIIIDQFIKLIINSGLKVDKIEFETNSLSSRDDQQVAIDKLIFLGYELLKSGGESFLQLKK